MRQYLTKGEACSLIKGLSVKDKLTLKERAGLESIRICLIGDGMGVHLWGKSIEETRPLFRSCTPPKADASESIRSNYEAYMEALEEALQVAKEG